ncbi:exosporium glycoprotein BclB-related protein [Lysinibacillus louembei]|uniref:Exosporium glycoprotein BclB-related protein n=1 Tax=Lysinibacillus louembei TaxID=1470088 RepID=A0ABZ0RW44_9BACI|nr:exosporium glycoprotein BclB-related protein [Lysinibacillus louembei]WPK11269.1 exosporium glycoprotein BclB-related protein [Lysinibacillus louembei]
MTNKYFRQHSGCGCSGGGGSCGRSGSANCTSSGPFQAIDQACIVTPPGNGVTGGSIIPFSSGTIPAVLTTLVGGLVGTGSLVGFGTSVPGVSILGGAITLPLGTLALPVTEAFSVPRAGTLTAISASFTATVLVALGSYTVNAQVYRAPAGSTTYTELVGATVDLSPDLTGPIALAQTVQGTATLPSIPVAAGDTLIMVFTASGTGALLDAAIITGTASAGLNIA